MGIALKNLKKTVFVFAAIFFIAVIYVEVNSRLTYSMSFVSMDTVVDIKIYGASSAKASNAAAEVKRLFTMLDSLWNPYSPNSEIYHIHTVFSNYPRAHKDSITSKITSVDTSVVVNPHTARIVKTSVGFSNVVSEKFNIAIGPLMDLWRTHAKQGKIPPNDTIRHIQKTGIIDVNNIVADTSKNTISLKKNGMRLNFGAVAKGWALYEAIGIMDSLGIKYFIINAGGDIYATSKGRRQFKVGIKNPFDSSGFLETVQIKNQAVATSGGYERYFVIDSVLYTHIIDPVLGYPIREQYSVTVILDNPVYADIWATLLSIDRSDSILKKFPANGRYFIALADTIISNF